LKQLQQLNVFENICSIAARKQDFRHHKCNFKFFGDLDAQQTIAQIQY